MKKYLIFGLLAAMLVTSTSIALAAKPDVTTTYVVEPSGGRAVVTIPERAVEVTHGIFRLGTAFDPGSGQMVEGYAILRYKKGFGKPSGAVCGNGVCERGENAKKCPADCGGGGEEPDTSSCYTYLSRGAKWKNLEPYLVNPTNTRGVAENFVASNFAVDIDKWEEAAQYNILGSGSSTHEALEADTASPDNKNEVYFGEISDPGAIAVTIIWGVFSGPPSQRRLVEWDQVYDQVDYDWSASGQAGKMDFENIATHELGHSVGLGDLYNSTCSEVTMYGLASYGEIKKRSLEDGDIIGVSKLYK